MPGEGFPSLAGLRDYLNLPVADEVAPVKIPRVHSTTRFGWHGKVKRSSLPVEIKLKTVQRSRRPDQNFLKSTLAHYNREWAGSSAWYERRPRKAEAAGSNPARSTIETFSDETLQQPLGKAGEMNAPPANEQKVSRALSNLESSMRVLNKLL